MADFEVCGGGPDDDHEYLIHIETGSVNVELVLDIKQLQEIHDVVSLVLEGALEDE